MPCGKKSYKPGGLLNSTYQGVGMLNALSLIPQFAGLFYGAHKFLGNTLFPEQQEDPIAPRPQSDRTFAPSAPNVPTFQLGGALSPPGANRVSEKQSIDKMLIELDGPIHEEGGIDIAGAEAEGKETLFRFKDMDGNLARYIFSNTKLVPGTKDSFAKTSLSIDGKTSIRPDSDKITNRTKERDLKGLMTLQEGIPDNNKDMSRKRGLQGGGPLDTSMFSFYNPIGGTFGGQRRGYGSNNFSVGGNSGGLPGGGQNQGFFGGLANSIPQGLGRSILGSSLGLLGAAGPLAQLRLANQPAEEVQFEQIQEPGAPQFIDPSQQVRSIGETFGGVKGGIRAAASRPGQLQANLIEAGTREAGAKAGVLGQAQNVNAQIANRRQALIQSTRARNAMLGRSEVLTNLASRGVREGSRIDAITALGNIGAGFGRDVRQNQAQNRQNELLVGLLKNAFPGLNFGGDGFTL